MSVAKNPFRSLFHRGSAAGHRNGAVSLRFACRRYRNCAFGYPNTRFAKVPKRSKPLLNVVLGPMEVIGCERAKKFIRSSVAETLRSGTETPDLLRFCYSRYPNGPKHSQTSFRARTSRLEVSVAKNPFRSLFHRGSAPGRRNRAVSLRFACRRYRNAPNHSRTSVWVQRRLLGANVRKNPSEVRWPKLCIRVPKHALCFDFRAVGIRMVRNTPKHHLGFERVDWKCP